MKNNTQQPLKWKWTGPIEKSGKFYLVKMHLYNLKINLRSNSNLYNSVFWSCFSMKYLKIQNSGIILKTFTHTDIN